jgi:hypothetical protein
MDNHCPALIELRTLPSGLKKSEEFLNFIRGLLAGDRKTK